MRFVRLALMVLLASSTAAQAKPVLDPLFSDHAVLQRERPITVRGSADPGERITVTLGGASASTIADRSGAWHVSFPAMRAGGPHVLKVTGAKGASATASNVLIGDVWLCSGQSNMEWPLARALNADGDVASANDPQLRLMKVPKNSKTDPQPFLAREVGWKPTTPDSAKDFSAACYFMVRALRQSHQVPIGAIDSTWGGTAIRSWMDEASIRGMRGAGDVELLERYRRDREGTVRKFGEQWASWWREHSGDKPGAEPWVASDRLRWSPVPKIGLWEEWGDPRFANFNGAMWARVRFTLTPEEAAEGATVSLGAIDDLDRTFVNGEAVGQTFLYNAQRNYPVRPGQLRAGTNEVVVYVLDTGGGGGFWSPPEELKLTLASGATKSLAQGWEYSLIAPEVGNPPLPPWSDAPVATTLYNGMIAPLGPVRLKGVAWYQGEADVGKPGYDALLAAWMKGWRAQFGDPKLPFLIVGLAGWGQPTAAPRASAWAALINEQRMATDADPRSALVSAIDIGERNDIHPTNKQEVGRRLTLAAEALAYGDAKGMLTPKLLSASRSGDSVIVRFDKAVASYGGVPVGIELCGGTQESCRYANARADGPTLVIAGDGNPATRVRYAWADFPIVNLYGPEMLPVPPFEVAID